MARGKLVSAPLQTPGIAYHERTSYFEDGGRVVERFCFTCEAWHSKRVFSGDWESSDPEPCDECKTARPK